MKLPEIAERVMENIARHRMLPGDGAAETNLGVAVSGGADSVCLLEVLRELAPPLHLRLSVVHLNHQLRGAGSDADASFVAALAEARGLQLHSRKRDVRTDAIEGGDNLEQAARAARYSFFRELVSSGAVERIATGHNRDDQAETVLFRILRGCGLTGLAGILPVTGEGIVRPLLSLTRGEIREFLCARSIEWREDPTNRDVAFARNRLRHETMPSLRRDFNPRLDAALASLAELAREEEEFWREEVPPPPLRNGTVLFETGTLAGERAALARR
ncbi:MAG: tRNA lysidine(34) synthetase TilS, partial [Bryobacteraceae bacterium]